jgi:hypothetical protein
VSIVNEREIMLKKIGGTVAALVLAGSVIPAAAGSPSPEVYGFKVEKINKDDDAYRYGNLYLLTGPGGREQYIIVRDVSGAVAIIKREPARTGK